MKFQTSLSVLAILATCQLIHAQEAQQQDEDVVSVQTVDNNTPALETDIPDIYWWKSLLSEEELSRYLTEPAQTAAGATEPAAVPTTSASDSVPSNDVNDAVTTTGVDTPASASGAASATGISAAATDASSTGAASAGSSSSSAGSPAVATSAISQSIGAPKPSGGSIPPSTSSNAVNHTSMATQTNMDMPRILFSVVAVSTALFKFLN
ncbi:hypothetical protein K501DRAFT_331505 [Backusella circina FSU 941]|nr:hypothetical protein K501DRAFT_331505 [Backusella circina FSU 941]